MSVIRSSIFRFALVPALALFGGDAFAGTSASITLQPVPPQTVPPSSYPPGTTIVGQEIVLGSVPARVWLEIHLTGWAPDVLKVVQATISVHDWEEDGGGFSGTNATCMGEPSLNAGNLYYAMQSCNTNTDCRMSLNGRDERCPTDSVSQCVTWNGSSPPTFPPGQFCYPWLMNTCDPRWIGTGITGTYAIDIDRSAYGFAADPGQVPIDFHPSYLGTLVIDVPANAKGTYLLDFKEDETYIEIDSPNQGEICGILPCLHIFNAAKIAVPCGRCCFGVASNNPQCIEAVSANECATHTASAVFQANEVCPDSGGPPCPACALDEHCDDGVFCNGVEVCDATGHCGPGQPPCEIYEECVEAEATCAPRIPTTTFWGTTMMTIFLLIAAKLRYRPARRAAIGLLIALANTYYSSSAFAGASTSMTLQPVAPQTFPPSNYPPGTTIVGQEIILGSVPARVWLEVLITGWAPENLKVVQATIFATDPDGGYSGTNSMCGDSPAVGAGDLRPAIQPCNTNADCRAAFITLNCPSSASQCAVWDGVSPPHMPAGMYCEYGFENICDARWAGPPFLFEDFPLFSINTRFGFALDPGESALDFQPSYIGTLVLDVPANAKGTYTIDFKEDETFMSNAGPPGNNTIPIQSMVPAKITIPCGRCCSGYASNQVSCADGVGIGECASQIDQVFTEGESCPNSGGPDCAECASDADCDDAIACTLNQCSPDHQCFFTPLDVACDDGVFCNGVEVCNPTSGCTPGQPPCESFQCDEEANECRPGIPTVSNWGLVALALVILIAAKLRYRRELAF